MNKDYQLTRLREILENPKQQSGLYLIETDLSDDDIESFVQETSQFRYVKEQLIPTTEGNTFELLIVGLSHICCDNNINTLLDLLLVADERKRDTILYSLLIRIMKHICQGERTVIHIYGRIDLLSLSIEDLCKFDAALTHHDETILVINKLKSINIPKNNTIINIKTLNNKIMDNRLGKVHISYKHDDAYEYAIKAIIAGLEKNNFQYSIDKYDIQYRDNIDEYEKEIGVSDRIIMFVIPAYFKSLDCMFEMTQIFKKGNIRERIFPLVDMGEIPRNGDGLIEIKKYWLEQKVKKSSQIQAEAGGSGYLLMEIQRIDDIINTLNELWHFICRNSTGNYKELIENDATLLMEELKKTLPQVTAHLNKTFVPSEDTQPTISRNVNQNGKNSLYIENYSGNITIN